MAVEIKSNDDQAGDATRYQRTRFEDILRRMDAVRLLDNRSNDEILGYGEIEIPRRSIDT